MFVLAPALCLAQSPPSYTISTVVGTCSASGTVPPCLGGYAGNGSAATSAQLNGPAAVIFDSSGNLYIADTNNQEVREVNTSGTINAFAGSCSAAPCGGAFSGDGGSATSAALNSPSGLAFDSSGNLYIADSDNFEVRKVAGGTISTAAGQNSQGAGFGGDLGPATSARLWNPTGVAVDSSGNIYIADPYNNVVRVVCENQTPIACTNNAFAGYTYAAGDINTFAGNDTNGAGYQGDGSPATGSLVNNPEAVTLDSNGNLYIADTGNNVIRKVTPAGIISTIAGNGVPGYSGDGGQATQAMLNAPKGIAVDSSNALYIADSVNCVIRVVEPDGNIYTIAGNGAAGYAGDGGVATSAQLWFPSGVALHGGNVYVADNGNNVIRLLTPAAVAPKINAGGVVNDASYTAPVAPGSIAAVFGTFYIGATAVATHLPLDTTLENLSLKFGGSTAAPLYYVSGTQVNVQVPWELAGQSTGNLAATLNGTTGTSQTVNIAPYAPAIFALNSQGTGPGAILDASYHLVSSSNPATAGSTTILIYCTGLGAVSANQPATGAPASLDSNKLAPTSAPVTVTIGGITTNASFSGLAPGYVGLYQVNALVPAGVTAGDSVPVTITIGGVTSNTVTIFVQ